MTERGLQYVIGRGAATRRGRLWPQILDISAFTGTFSIFNGLVYFAMADRAHGFDMETTWPVLFVMLLVPNVIGWSIAPFVRDQLRVTMTVFVTITVYAFAVTALSALRFTMSFSAVLTCVILTLLAMTYVAARLWRTRHRSVVILDFERAAELSERIGGTPMLTRDPSAAPPDADAILIDVDRHHTAEWAQYLHRAYMRGLSILPWPRFLELRLGQVDVRSFDISDISYGPAQIVYSRLKRTIDLVLIIVTSPVWLPLLLLVGAYVGLRAGRPMLFRQRRRGQGDRDFTLLKFRTMQVNSGTHAATRSDGRVVRGLGWIRRWRLDELPQLINVLRGDMSLVGPRPESVELAAEYEKDIPQYLERLLVLPGITGWAQVNSPPSSSIKGAEDKLAFDLFYVKYLSPDLDLLILAKTLEAIIRIPRS